MKVILINPPVRAGKYRSTRATIPPLGIGYLAAYLDRNSIDCEVIDGKLEGITVDQISTRVAAAKPELIGISAMTPDIMATGEIAQNTKQFLPDTPVVVGGAHAIAMPQGTLDEFPAIDYVVTGEGEQALLELTEAIRGKRDLKSIEGLGFRRGTEVVINPPRQYLKDLDTLPFPAWNKFRHQGHSFGVLSARGCPYNCTFCMRALGKVVRYRSPSNVVEEIEQLVENYGAREIIFHDETFTQKKARIKEIAELLIKKGLHKKIKWVAQTRVDTADLDVFERMKAAGCRKVEVGVESGNQDVLNRVNKGINLARIEETVQLAKKAGLHIACTFIIGHPFETEQTIQDTIDFAVKLKPNSLSLGIMSPYPGTEIWKMAQAGDGNYRLLSRNWEEFLRFSGGCLELENLSRHRLEQLQVKAYLSFYLRTFNIIGLARYGLPRWRQSWAVAKKLLLSRKDRSGQAPATTASKRT